MQGHFTKVGQLARLNLTPLLELMTKDFVPY